MELNQIKTSTADFGPQVIPLREQLWTSEQIRNAWAEQSKLDHGEHVGDTVRFIYEMAWMKYCDMRDQVPLGTTYKKTCARDPQKLKWFIRIQEHAARRQLQDAERTKEIERWHELEKLKTDGSKLQ